jgi:hypothetical protein
LNKLCVGKHFLTQHIKKKKKLYKYYNKIHSSRSCDYFDEIYLINIFIKSVTPHVQELLTVLRIVLGNVSGYEFHMENLCTFNTSDDVRA